MININFFENIKLYRNNILDNSLFTDILYTKVIINNILYNYHQSQNTIIISDTIYGDIKNILNVINLKKHLDLLELSIKSGNKFYIKLNNLILTEYKFVDCTRIFKLNKLLNNDRKIIKTLY